MGIRVYVLLLTICLLFGTSYQKKYKLRNRMDQLESMVERINIRTREDISELREVVELIQNKSEDSPCVTCDAAVLTNLESDMKDHEIRIIAIHNAISDEKIHVRERMKEIGVIKSELMHIGDMLKGEITRMNDSLAIRLHKVTSDLMDTKIDNDNLTVELKTVKSDLIDLLMLTDTNRVNSKLRVELLGVKAELVKMKNDQTKQIKESNAELLQLRQMIMEIQQKNTEISTAITMTTQQETTTEPSTTTATVAVPDPCPSGWDQFQNKCYLFEREKTNWYLAKEKCTERDSVLAEPDTREILQYLWQLATKKQIWNLRYIWLGGTDSQTEGKWIWSGSGRPIGSSLTTLWAPGQPNTGGTQDCLLMDRRGWHDGFCSWSNGEPYMCEKQASK